MCPTVPSIPGAHQGQAVTVSRGRHRAGGERAADAGPSFAFIKKHVFGVYQGKTNNLY